MMLKTALALFSLLVDPFSFRKHTTVEVPAGSALLLVERIPFESGTSTHRCTGGWISSRVIASLASSAFRRSFKEVRS